MKRLSVILLLIAGCGSGLVDPAATRPTLGEARLLCLTSDDDNPTDFDAVVAVFRAVRTDGVSESESMFAALAACRASCESQPEACEDECGKCSIAIIGAIYR